MRSIKVAPEQETTHLVRRIGMLDAAAHITGAIIGSGIFISPYVVLEATKSPGMAVLVWVLAGVIS